MADSVDEFLITDLRARDPERWLTSLWAPAEARPLMLAIHAFDLELQKVISEAKDPMLAEIRLAWWREQVERISDNQPAEPQPLLQALASNSAQRAIDLKLLTQIEDGFLPFLSEEPLNPLYLAQSRGAPLFKCLAQAALGRALSDRETADAALAGTRWALIKLWRGGWGQAESRLSKADAPDFPTPPQGKLPTSLALMNEMAELDWADLLNGAPLQPLGSARRQWKMFKKGLFSR